MLVTVVISYRNYETTMPLAKIDITVPENIWISKISKKYSDLTFQVISTQYGENTAIGLIELQTQTENPIPVISEIDGQDNVIDLELLWKYEDEALLQIETTNPQLLIPVWRAGVPLKTPFTISNGTASWEISTSRPKLSQLGQQLDSLGITYDIRSVREFHEGQADELMTDRQQEILLAAFEAGYYDTPRQATQTEVAGSVNVTKATCSDILHRAEGKIIGWFIKKHMGNTIK